MNPADWWSDFPDAWCGRWTKRRSGGSSTPGGITLRRPSGTIRGVPDPTADHDGRADSRGRRAETPAPPTDARATWFSSDLPKDRASVAGGRLPRALARIIRTHSSKGQFGHRSGVGGRWL